MVRTVEPRSIRNSNNEVLDITNFFYPSNKIYMEKNLDITTRRYRKHILPRLSLSPSIYRGSTVVPFPGYKHKRGFQFPI